MQKIQRALISVSDKSLIVELAEALNDMKVEILSTGGTAKKIVEAGIPVRLVSDFTGFPEVLDGRVKTLHPIIYMGLLAMRDDPGHMSQLELHGDGTIDLVVVNLYPFQQTVNQPGVTRQQAIENIDIGGVGLVRAAAKNHEQGVVVLTDPDQYQAVIAEMRSNDGCVSDEKRSELACLAFERTANYDKAIAGYLKK